MTTMHIETYFNGKKWYSIFIIALGIALIYLAWWLNESRSEWVGAVFPLSGGAAILLIEGVSILLRNGKQKKQSLALSKANPTAFREAESLRMKSVFSGITIARYIEFFLIPVGFACYYLFKAHYFYQGFGIALSVLAVLLLLLDVLEEWRGRKYCNSL